MKSPDNEGRVVYRNGKRVAVAITCWLLASVGVLSSFIFFWAAIESVDDGLPGSTGSIVSYFALGIPIAWLSLGVMTSDWIRNSRTHWAWRMLGVIVGLPLAIVFIPFIVFYFSLVGLAVYLVFWHSNPKNGAK